MILFKFLNETRKVLCPAFKETCKITQLTIFISWALYGKQIPRFLNFYFIITRLVESSHSSVADIWGTYAELVSLLVLFGVVTAYYWSGLKYYPKFWFFILGEVIWFTEFSARGCYLFRERVCTTVFKNIEIKQQKVGGVFHIQKYFQAHSQQKAPIGIFPIFSTFSPPSQFFPACLLQTCESLQNNNQ